MRGVELTLKGDDIVYRAPQGAMSPALLASLQSDKMLLLQQLRSESTSRPTGLDHLARVVGPLREIVGDVTRHPYARFVEPVKSELLARIGLDKQFVRGQGCQLWDNLGYAYLDFVAQYGALPFGHNPEEIWEAVQRVRSEQLPNLVNNSLLNSAGRLSQRLLELAPAGMEHVIFCNSGAEATEVALKLCRAATGRRGVVSTRDAFHGLTTGSLAASGCDAFQEGFFVRSADFVHVPFGNPDALHDLLSRHPAQYAAFLVEPIQGEAGILLPPRGYLAAVRKICSRFDVLMVADEVQTGLGRTGALFACEHEGVIPDVLTLAKALGGGLVPIAAVLCRPQAYTTAFGLRHSSTFAGNALACEVGLASLDLLTRDNCRLVNHVSEVGQYLQDGLLAIQSQFPQFVAEVRGQGFMQAIEFQFDCLRDTSGMMSFLADQQLLVHLMVSHLLNVHRIRVALSFVRSSALRIEPPLVMSRCEIDTFVKAMQETLQLVAAGNTAVLLAPMIDLEPATLDRVTASAPPPAPLRSDIAARREMVTQPDLVGEFGFLIHLASLDDLVSFDGSLAVYTAEQLAWLKSKLVKSSDPFVIGRATIPSRQGIAVRGHFVMVPYTPAELMEMPPPAAMELVARAAEVARDAGARVIGLGGFTSIVTKGGMTLDRSQLPPVTTGNAYTVAASWQAIERACQWRGRQLAELTVAVVGATGQIGQAISLLCAEQAGKLILVGRDAHRQQTHARLREVAMAAIAHLRNLHACPARSGSTPLLRGIVDQGCTQETGRRSLESQLLDRLLAQGQLELVTDLDRVADADVVVTATSAIEPFLETRHLKPGVIVCDSARPANVTAHAIAERHEMTWIEGGLIRIPGQPQLDVFAGPRPDCVYACVAETALLSFEPTLSSDSPDLLACSEKLQIEAVRRLDEWSVKHGFQVVGPW